MIHATGYGHDGKPRALLGLNTADLVKMGAGEVISVELDRLNPLMPALTLMLTGGPSDQGMLDEVQRLFPQTWLVDQPDLPRFTVEQLDGGEPAA